MTTAEHACPCGEAIEKTNFFDLDGQQWVEFDHGLVIHRFEMDADGRIKNGPPGPVDDGA